MDERRRYREKEDCAPSNPIVLVTLKEPLMPEHDTVEYVFYIFPKHRRPVLSRCSMAIHNGPALWKPGGWVSRGLGGGPGGSRARKSIGVEFPATDVTMEKLFRSRAASEAKPQMENPPDRSSLEFFIKRPIGRGLLPRPEETITRRLVLFSI